MSPSPDQLEALDKLVREEVRVELFIETHPDGATLEEIGGVFGVSKVAIHKTLNEAILKIRTRFIRAGWDRTDCRFVAGLFDKDLC